MHLSFFVIVIFGLFFLEEFFHLLVDHFLEGMILFLALFLSVAGVYLLAWPAYSAWEWLSATAPTLADLIVEPLCVFAVVVFPFVMFFDSLTNFKGTRAVFRTILRRKVTA